ncbi:hypothetical protein AJ80_00398 [Polytolypa hystricis UAMH7299]|uniref:Cell division control protein n=1 Tax=Polytolypa hystricis (strain UAMH7299) TaxID=1447883 RepID=A0A2B7Z3Z3_POLH7|nr:hypothetical protein AJ80_00398 [Polytolypa hystricis UAMH7299]
MASSVLGKRQRCSCEPSGTPASLRSSRKRQAREAQIHHDDSNNEEPSISPTRYRRSTRGVACQQQENITGAKRSSTRIVPLKHTVPVETAISVESGENDISTELVTDENSAPAKFSTPRTSRFRDALPTPVPVTPRHRVKVLGKPLTPRTPRILSTPTTTNTVYTPARQLFARSANPGKLVGRDAERDELAQFIQNAVDGNHGGCLYVSGPPGTGKSALVGEVCQDKQLDKAVKVASINCASMTSSRDIYGKLIEELCENSQVFKKSEVEVLRAMFLQKNRSGDLYLVSLDEIDHLLTTDVEILYSLFEWSLQPNSRLILVGIANALDLTDRFLPRLKAKNLKPQLLPFLPYSASQITSIITTRLRSVLPEGHNVTADFVPFVHPAAIQLCSRKVASQTGDLRKAFDIIRRTIDLIERETQQKAANAANAAAGSSSKTPLIENMNLSSPLSPPTTPVHVHTPATAPRATVAHVARVTSAVFGNGTAQRLQGLNLQQKAALCSLIALGRKQRDQSSSAIFKTPSKSSPRAMAPTIKQLFETYCTLCRRDNMLHPLTSTEFRDVISSLETLGLVGEVQANGRRGNGGSGATSSASLRTPTKMSQSQSALDEKGLVCYVGEKEIEAQISGAGEGILKALLRGED